MAEKEAASLNRRGFLGSISKLTALGTLGVTPFAGFASAPVASRYNGSHVFAAGPYLQAVGTNQISIRWITALPSYSWVEYGKGNDLSQKAHTLTDGLVDAYNRVHEVVIEDLEPGSTYHYRIVSKEIIDFQPYKLVYGSVINSDIYAFSTVNPASREVNWIVLNDIHDRPQSFAHLMQLNKNDPYDFVFLNGDMFDYQTDEQQLIDHLIKPCTESFAASKPFMFVRGNHETRGKFARQLKDYFTNPGGSYFSMEWGPVFAIALDTGEDKVDDHPVYAGIVDFDQYRRQQAKWLEKQLQSKAAKKAKYRVVMMHIPPHYSGDWHGTMHCRQLFSPLFDKYGVDLVISGHTHTYGVHPPVKGEHSYPIIIGGGPKDGKRTIIKVNATQQQLNVKMIRDDGAEVGSYRI